MARRGMGTGKGKGYRNIIGSDSRVHKMSACGIKQPQRVNPKIDSLRKPKYDQIVVDGKWYNQNPNKDNEVLIKGKWKKVYYKTDHSGEFRFSKIQSKEEKEMKKYIEDMFK